MRETDSSKPQNLPCVELYRQESSIKKFHFLFSFRWIPNFFHGVLLYRGQEHKKAAASRVRLLFLCSQHEEKRNSLLENRRACVIIPLLHAARYSLRETAAGFGANHSLREAGEK